LEAQNTINSQDKTEQKKKKKNKKPPKNSAGGITIPGRAIAIKQHGSGTRTDMKTSGTE
jgi:hypothetical protein